MTRKNHFTARLVVEEVVFGEKSGAEYRAPKIETRDVVNVAEVVVRDETLDGLEAKIVAHAALLTP